MRSCPDTDIDPKNFIYSFVFFVIYPYITNSQSDQFLDGLIVPFVEHCAGIADLMGWSPVET